MSVITPDKVLCFHSAYAEVFRKEEWLKEMLVSKELFKKKSNKEQRKIASSFVIGHSSFITIRLCLLYYCQYYSNVESFQLVFCDVFYDLKLQRVSVPAQKTNKASWVIKGSQQVRRKVSIVFDAKFYYSMTKYHIRPWPACLALTERLLLVLIHAIFPIFIWNLVTQSTHKCIPISQYLKGVYFKCDATVGLEGWRLERTRFLNKVHDVCWHTFRNPLRPRYV